MVAGMTSRVPFSDTRRARRASQRLSSKTVAKTAVPSTTKPQQFPALFASPLDTVW